MSDPALNPQRHYVVNGKGRLPGDYASAVQDTWNPWLGAGRFVKHFTVRVLIFRAPPNSLRLIRQHVFKLLFAKAHT